MTSTITTFTHGLADSGDVQLASRLSDKYHIPHLRMIFDDNFFESLPQYWRETVCVSEGALGIENALNVVSWKTESQSTISLDSHGGPLFRRQIFKSQEGYLRRSKDFIKTFFHLSASALLHSEFMNSELQEVGVKIGMRSLSEYFSSLPTDLTAGDKIDLYYLEQMCAHKYSQYGNAQLNYIGLSHPLLSLGTYIPITGIPSRERKRNIIYHYLFSRFAPELKHIRMDNSGYPVPYFGYRILRYIPPIYEKIVRKMPEYFYRFSLRKPVISHRMLVRKNFRELKEILLGTNAKTDSLFVSAKIEKALSDFETGKKDNYAELLQAANLKLLLEYFLQNP
jgi:hypothetical protein